MGANIIAQIILTPLYLKILGNEEFGLLMIFLNILTFAVFGIAWVSGGLVRVLGEYWTTTNLKKFRETLVLGKFVFTSYAILVSSISLIIFLVLKSIGLLNNIELSTILFICLYFVLSYEALSERQAFVSTNWQALGNFIEIIKVLVFAFLTFYLLPYYRNIDFIFLALIFGIISQRIITGLYLRKKIQFLGWGKYKNSMKPDFTRFLSKQGLGYFGFGTLVLLLQSDVVIIGIIGGADVAGKFVLLWKIPEVLGLLLAKIPTTLEPKIIHLDSRSEVSKIKTIFSRGKNSFFIMCALVSVLYMFFGHYFVNLWVGESAPSEIWMYYVAGFSLFFFSISRWPISFAFAQIKLNQLIKVSIIEFLFKLFFTLVLFNYFSYASPLIGMIIIHILYVSRGYQKIN